MIDVAIESRFLCGRYYSWIQYASARPTFDLLIADIEFDANNARVRVRTIRIRRNFENRRTAGLNGRDDNVQDLASTTTLVRTRSAVMGEQRARRERRLGAFGALRSQ